MDVREAKKAWRRLVVQMFELVPRQVRRELDAVLEERVREYVFQSGARSLLGFAPMLDEPDLSGFFRRWVAEGGSLALPVWLGGENMLMRRVTDLDAQLRPGRGGILEPLAGLPEVAPDELDLVITPGRVFSEGRARMGRGSGCYDALFRGHRLTKVGVAYDFQVFPEIPTYAGDVSLDLVITPSRLVGQDESRL